jgi:hypothetical protein
MSEDEANAIADRDPMDADTYAEAQKAFDTVTARLPK